MWQSIIVITIVAVTAALVAWNFYRKLMGKTSGCGGGCGGCGGGSVEGPCCGSGPSEAQDRPPAHETLRPLGGNSCGCKH
ncbi:MAG: FeoB-associated Cys-rich membrane protein [Humidesulfovibrio sp.]|nr:FeoB-associated Cys-rich membrane protein [Humidesulfovibrio sp.]